MDKLLLMLLPALFKDKPILKVLPALKV